MITIRGGLTITVQSVWTLIIIIFRLSPYLLIIVGHKTILLVHYCQQLDLVWWIVGYTVYGFEAVSGQVWIKCGSSVDQVWVKSTLSSVWRTCQITCGAGLCTSADLWPCSLFKLNKVQLKLKVMSLGNLLLRQLHNNSSNVMSVCHLTAQYS